MYERSLDNYADTVCKMLKVRRCLTYFVSGMLDDECIEQSVKMEN